MARDLDNLKEQAENLQACLERLRQTMDTFPDQEKASWMEGMLASSLVALKRHIQELERLEYRSPMQNTLFKR